MSIIRTMGRTHGSKDVEIVHAAGTDSETRTPATALIQGASGIFEVTTPIYEGDIVELDDPRGGRDRRLVAKVKVNDFGPPGMHHISVEWGKAPAVRAAPVRRLALEKLHPVVVSASSDLFADGQYAAAVHEAFKSLEVRVREMSGLDKSGAPPMGDAFGSKEPAVDVATGPGRSGQDEREGFLSLFRGSMLAIRNPKAHGLFTEEDPQSALEYLAFASLLHRRLDGGTTR